MEKTQMFPYIGIIARDGYVEHYDEPFAKRHQYRHAGCLSSEGLSHYDKDDTLRFVMDGLSSNTYVLVGRPALDPFRTGRGQIHQLAVLAVEHGADPMTKIRVGDHQTGGTYEGQVIGRLATFLKQRF